MKDLQRRNTDPNIVWGQILAKPDPSRGALSTQLVMAFVRAINTNQVSRGVRIPSSRALAESLGIGRNTAIAAINTLIEQGYLESRDRSGVFVAHSADIAPRPNQTTDKLLYDWTSRLARVEKRSTPTPENMPRATYNFRYGQFDPEAFPTGHWRQCERSASAITEIAEWGRDMFDRDDAGLIESLVRHVLPSHGIWAEPEEVLVTLGGQEGRYLVAQLLCRAGVTVGLEQPGLPDILAIVASTASTPVDLPLDHEGVMLSAELRQCDVAFMTPGHQCPTTAVMSAGRRAALLELARRRDMVVVEDTYETEVLSHGRVMPSLKSLDEEGRVIHIGSISKAVAPGLRAGFVVAAAPVIARLREIRRLIHRHPPGNIQRSLAMFIDRGYYHSFLRKVSSVLDRRGDTLRAALASEMPYAKAQNEGASSFWITLPAEVDAVELCAEMESVGILLEAGGRFFRAGRPANHLRICVSQIAESDIAPGIARVSKAVQARMVAPD